MQVSVEESGVIERKVTVIVARAEVDQEIDKRLKDMAKRARIDGFRPGKAPRDIVRQRYGARITHEVVNDTINSSYREALGKEAIVPAGLVSIDPKPLDAAGDDLSYVATIELYPEILTPTLAGITVEKSLCAVTAEEVESTLQDIRQKNATFTPKGGAPSVIIVPGASGESDQSGKSSRAEKGDRLTIDFDGRIAGQPFAGGTHQDYQFVLGDGRMFVQFETDLVGVGNAETKQITVTFPDHYPAEEVAGKAAEFTVTVKSVEQAVLPELNDAFAEKLGITDGGADGGMKKLRAEIKSSLQRELTTRLDSQMRERVMDALLKVNDIEAPKGLVEAEIDHTIRAGVERMEAQGMRPPADNERQLERARLADTAKRRVILGLIVRGIIEKYDLKADSAVVREKINEMTTGHQDAEKMVNWYYADPTRLQSIEAMVLEEQVVARMVQTATITEKQVSFQELMNPPTRT